MKPHIFHFMVAYADTDAGGIVYHGRYIEIAERARMEWISDALPPDGDIGFVIRELNIKYKKPLQLGDRFVVETYSTDVGAASIKIEQKFVKDGEIYAILNGTAAYIDGDLKPKRIPESLITKVQSAKCN
ncbi:MAG: acyl-CoA thioesterase [Rickettsiales bacterium]|jgi:acyl-CoA thioester hydrolase|nr:acyl-CoA thioesterase [Rickettsiales bacterium]